jgi:adenylylsulfate kinase-like enzyme
MPELEATAPAIPFWFYRVVAGAAELGGWLRQQGARNNTAMALGLAVLVSFISPFRSEGNMARDLVGADEFIEIYVNTPLDICERRDPKGLYKLARAGKLPNLTGIGSPYEQPEISLNAGSKPLTGLVEQILDVLKDKGIV